ncbi:MAG: PadR family transcriptional regulator [Acidimicrobiales bacterium]
MTPTDGGHSVRRAVLSHCLLLLLWESPQHGYELIERLKPFGFDWGDRGFSGVYHELKKLEERQLVRAALEVSQSGPARRVYQLTPVGAASIEDWAPRMEELQSTIAEWLARYRRGSDRNSAGLDSS